MAKFNTQEIQAKALELLASAPDGIRYGALVKLVHAYAPDTPINTVNGAVHSLRVNGDKITIPTKGLWTLKSMLAENIDA